ncbi:MAG: TlpA family protein disulfide reductase [Fidelibacterota bacterium]
MNFKRPVVILPIIGIPILAGSLLYFILFIKGGGNNGEASSGSHTDISPAAQLFRQMGLQQPGVKTEAPDFSLETIEGELVSLSDYRGNVVFLNFWATWCTWCRWEMPIMESLYNRYRESGFEILAVDVRESDKTVKKYLQEVDLTFTIVMDRDGKVGQMYDIQAFPTTYLIDRKGNILARAVGAREWTKETSLSLFDAILKEDFKFY